MSELLLDRLRQIGPVRSVLDQPGSGAALTGAALGLTLGGIGLVADMQLRRLSGLDAGVVATFASTATHALSLTWPFLFGRIFLAMGRSEAALRVQLARTAEGERRQRDQSQRDPMTGLFNRAFLMTALEEGLATGEWRKRGALIYMLDLDDFKHVNDTFGHRAGDVVLTATAERLAGICVGDDFAVRLGGDEFMVVHFPAERNEAPARLAEAIVAALTADIRYDGIVLNVGTSIGIAHVGIDGANWSQAIACADIALYEAKREVGSAHRQFAPSMKRTRDADAATEMAMKRGLERGEFELYYQPIFGTRSGTLRSFEALLRWNHPERGLVPPAEFIPIAEASGFIVQLGRHVLVEACRAAAAWPKPIGIAVNLSPVQFKDARLAAHVGDALAASGLAPGRLDLEITESLVLEHTPRTLRILDDLRALGVRITMDDFGTGFSSISNLREMRFDRIKIDRCFTRLLDAETKDAEIVRTIVRLSKTLQMETVLEGVETQEQVAFAQAEGMTEVQGFFYARPMRASEVDRLIAARQPAAPAEATARPQALSA